MLSICSKVVPQSLAFPYFFNPLFLQSLISSIPYFFDPLSAQFRIPAIMDHAKYPLSIEMEVII